MKARNNDQRERMQLAYSMARLKAFKRALSACEGCGRRLHPEAFHAHHRLPRAPIRIDCPCNLLVLCHRCHEATHKMPARSRELGRIIPRADARIPCEVPVFVRRDFVLFDHEGGRTLDLSRVSCDTQRR